MQACSYDLREQVVRACDEGRGTRQQIAANLRERVVRACDRIKIPMLIAPRGCGGGSAEGVDR
jgi:hypothetical protein